MIAPWRLAAALVALALLPCGLAFAGPGAEASAQATVGCDRRVEGAKPLTTPPKRILVVPGVLWLGAPKNAFIAGSGWKDADGRGYKIPVSVSADQPGRSLLLSVAERGALLHYPGVDAHSVRFRACVPGHPGWGDNPPVGRWTSWAGGITVDEPRCVHLVVRSGTQVHRLQLGLGVRCP